MRDFSHSSDSLNHQRLFTRVGHSFRILGTHKRTSFAMAGAFAFAGVAAGLGMNNTNAPDHSQDTPRNASQTIVSPPSSSDDQSSSAPDPLPLNNSDGQAGSNSVSTNVTSVNGNTHVTVNGQEVPVPQNGSAQQTITTPNGGQAQVSINSQGNAGNTNSSSLNVNVSSGTSSSSSSSSSTNSSSTFISNSTNITEDSTP